MDHGPDIPVNFSDLKCHKVDKNVGKTFVDEATEAKHLLFETKSENISVDPLLGIDEHNPRTCIEMSDVSHGFELGFPSNYGGLDSYNTLEGEEGLKREIYDGFMDDVDNICTVEYLSTAFNPFLLDFQFTGKVSELDSGLPGASISGSESQSPGFCGSVEVGNGGSESSKEVVPETDCRNESVEKEMPFDNNQMLNSRCAYQKPIKESMIFNSSAVQKLDELDDEEKPIASFIAPEKKILVSVQETELSTCLNKKNLRKSIPRLEWSSQASYDFRPRKGCTKKCPPIMDQQSDHEHTASEFEDDHPKAKASKSRRDRRKHQRMWTLAEVMKLVDGISQFGVGKWTDIKRLLFPSAAYRTPIDLRDKWRNLLRASYSGKVDRNRRQAMKPLPSHFVHRIRELAELHPYPNSNSSQRRTPRRKNQT